MPKSSVNLICLVLLLVSGCGPERVSDCPDWLCDNLTYKDMFAEQQPEDVTIIRGVRISHKGGQDKQFVLTQDAIGLIVPTQWIHQMCEKYGMTLQGYAEPLYSNSLVSIPKRCCIDFWFAPGHIFSKKLYFEYVTSDNSFNMLVHKNTTWNGRHKVFIKKFLEDSD